MTLHQRHCGNVSVKVMLLHAAFKAASWRKEELGSGEGGDGERRFRAGGWDNKRIRVGSDDVVRGYKRGLNGVDELS